MKKFFVLTLIVLMWSGVSFAAGTQEQAKALVDEAAAFMQANGKEKALAEVSNPKGQFAKGELYVFVYDMNATVLAHPVNAKLIGKNLMEVPDANGKFFRKEVIEKAKSTGTGWVDYKYKNPENNQVEHKTTYLRKVEDMVICCGVYK